MPKFAAGVVRFQSEVFLEKQEALFPGAACQAWGVRT